MEGRRLGEHMLVCPGLPTDCQRHVRVGAKMVGDRPVQHRVWELLLCLTEQLAKQVKWIHTSSHIKIPGNTRADHVADVGRRQSPLLFGQISVYPRRTEPEAAGFDEEWDEEWVGWELAEEPKALGPPDPPNDDKVANRREISMDCVAKPTRHEPPGFEPNFLGFRWYTGDDGR